MRWPAVMALGGVAMLAACLRASSVECANGAVCPEGQACTENAQSLCGPPTEVEQCAGAPAATPTQCTISMNGEQGVCSAGVCVACAPERLDCPVPEWTQITSMAVEDLKAIHVAGPTLAYAVGAQSTVLRYDGTAWSRVPGPPGLEVSLIGVWGTATELFVASSVGLVYEQSGTGWVETNSSGPPFLNALWGTSRTSLFAAGSLGTLGIYDGQQWSWVVDPMGTRLDPTPAYNALWGSSAADVIAVASEGLISHHDGANAWTAVIVPGQETAQFLGVHGAGATVFAVGRKTENQMEQLVVVQKGSGRTWQASPVTSTAVGALNGVFVVDAAEAYAVGTDGLVLRHDGSTWIEMKSPITTTLDLHAISAVGDTLFAVGQGGTIWRYDRPTDTRR